MLALVTGASSGMGLEYARQLAAKGWDLVVVSNQAEELEAAAAMLSSEYGIRAIARYQDLAEDNAAEELYTFCKSESLQVDMLINNAGMFFFKELGTDTLPKATAMVHVHVVTPTRLCALFGEDMKERRQGYILNMSSMTAHIPMPGITIYSATKAYLKSFGESLWYEMKPYGVKVTTVMPAAVATTLYKLKPSLLDLGIKTGFIKTPEWLVRRGLKGLEKGRMRVRPGAMNYWLPFIIGILPKRLVGKLWKRFK